MNDKGLLPLKGLYEDTEKTAVFYKKIFDDFPALIWMAGTDGLCWYFNKKWLDFRGRKLEEEFGNGWTEGIHKEEFDFCLDFYLKHFNKQEPFSMEYRLMRADGQYRWILDFGIPFYGLENEFQGYIGSCYDITDEKNNVIELRQSREMALEALNSKSQLLAYVSHEIRNPLNVINGVITLLSQNNYDNDTNEMLGYMQSSANLLIGLVNNLLDLSKFESGKVVYIKEPVDIRNIKREIDKIYLNYIVSDGLSFISTIEGDFPSVIYADEMKLMQIISNLISNSIKFTKQGSIALNLIYIAESSHLKIVVADTGVGINPEKHAHLFEEYVQGDNTIFKQYGGTGLGLSIVKTLTDLMCGEIKVNTAQDIGTSFEITFNVEAP